MEVKPLFWNINLTPEIPSRPEQVQLMPYWTSSKAGGYLFYYPKTNKYIQLGGEEQTIQFLIESNKIAYLESEEISKSKKSNIQGKTRDIKIEGYKDSMQKNYQKSNNLILQIQAFESSQF